MTVEQAVGAGKRMPLMERYYNEHNKLLPAGERVYLFKETVQKTKLSAVHQRMKLIYNEEQSNTHTHTYTRTHTHAHTHTNKLSHTHTPTNGQILGIPIVHIHSLLRKS